MKKGSLIVGIILIVVLVFWKTYIPAKTILGKYANNNTKPVLEGPNSIDNFVDTLILLNGNNFKSRTWGNGNYKIKSGLFKTEICLTYNVPFGSGSFSTTITKTFFGKLRIWLDHDLGFYFEKVE